MRCLGPNAEHAGGRPDQTVRTFLATTVARAARTTRRRSFFMSAVYEARPDRAHRVPNLHGSR